MKPTSLLGLQLPCDTNSNVLDLVARAIYGDGTMTMQPEMLLPLLQLGDAIQVSPQIRSGPSVAIFKWATRQRLPIESLQWCHLCSSAQSMAVSSIRRVHHSRTTARRHHGW